MDKQLITLCEKDSRLGFHAEAEGYRYFPEKIRWRMQQLKDVLANDVPDVKKIIRKDQLLFPEYTGAKPDGPVAYAIPCDSSFWSSPGLDRPGDLSWQSCAIGGDKPTVWWAASYDEEALYIMLLDSAAADQTSLVSSIANVHIKIEPLRLFPCKHFWYYPGVEKLTNGAKMIKESGVWRVVVRIPRESIRLDAEGLHPVRVDIRVQKRDGRTSAWRPNNQTTSRLILGSDNPTDLGWLLFRN